MNIAISCKRSKITLRQVNVEKFSNQKTNKLVLLIAAVFNTLNLMKGATVICAFLSFAGKKSSICHCRQIWVELQSSPYSKIEDGNCHSSSFVF